MVYTFQIKKYRNEDNLKNGETGDFFEKNFEVQIKSDNLLNAYIEFWNQYCNIPNFDYTQVSYYIPFYDYIFCARTENENEQYPSEEELKDWKHDKINLFAATFEIKIVNQNLQDLNLKTAE